MRTKAKKREVFTGLEPLELILPVCCFAPGSPLREAFAVFWHPMTRNDSVFAGLVHGAEPGKRPRRGPECSKKPGHRVYWSAWQDHIRPAWVQAICKVDRDSRGGGKDPRKDKLLRKVRVLVDYPLNTSRSCVKLLDVARVGDVFGIAHDLYAAAYAEDKKRGGGARMGGKLVNRGFGPVVWGHDFGDLVFERVYYTSLLHDPDGAVGVFTFDIGS